MAGNLAVNVDVDSKDETPAVMSRRAFSVSVLPVLKKLLGSDEGVSGDGTHTTSDNDESKTQSVATKHADADAEGVDTGAGDAAAGAGADVEGDDTAVTKQDSIPTEPHWKAVKPKKVRMPRPAHSRVEGSDDEASAADNVVAFTLDHLFTEEECKALIEITEGRAGDLGLFYGKALVNVGGGRQRLLTDVRDSDRCMVDDKELAQWIWNRVKAHVPSPYKGRVAVGLNERLRFLRYDEGGYFQPHMDGTFVRNRYFGERAGERSQLTLLFYLNDGYTGGCTTFVGGFFEDADRVAVKPHPGLVLIHQHDLMHEGAELESGRKYVIRTDVMFSKDRVDESPS